MHEHIDGSGQPVQFHNRLIRGRSEGGFVTPYFQAGGVTLNPRYCHDSGRPPSALQTSIAIVRSLPSEIGPDSA